MSSSNDTKRQPFAHLSLSRIGQLITALLAMVAITVQPVAAQSILRDAETEALFSDMVSPLVAVSETGCKRCRSYPDQQ